MTVNFTPNRNFALPQNDEIARLLADETTAAHYFKDNNDILRNYIGNTDMISFTPQVFSNHTMGTELTFGTGATVAGRYRALPGNFILGNAEITLGTTPFDAGGTVILYFTIPVMFDNTFYTVSTSHGLGNVIGTGICRDLSSVSEGQNTVLQLVSNNPLVAMSTEKNEFARWWQSTAPFTWVEGDRFSYGFFYKGEA